MPVEKVTPSTSPTPAPAPEPAASPPVAPPVTPTADQVAASRAATRRAAGLTAAAAPTRRTRAGAAWVGICLGALVLVALIIFMLQNTGTVEVAFLGMRGTAPLAVTLLIAGVGVGIVALVIGTWRISQLRHRLGVDRKAAKAAKG